MTNPHIMITLIEIKTREPIRNPCREQQTHPHIQVTTVTSIIFQQMGIVIGLTHRY